MEEPGSSVADLPVFDGGRIQPQDAPATAIIFVTHDEKIIPTFKRACHIRDGRTIEEVGDGRVLVGTS